MIIDSERLKKQFADLERLKKELEAIKSELEDIKKDILYPYKTSEK
jgi:predicted  nucleic acid-binding Zn-ribbon protein